MDVDIDAGQWNALVQAAARYNATQVASFLLANTAFPRSVRLNLAQIECI